MVPWTYLSPQSKRHLDRFSHFFRAYWCETPTSRQTDRQVDRQTDRQTDHATQSVTIGCDYVPSTVMRPNNSSNQNNSLFYTSYSKCVNGSYAFSASPLVRFGRASTVYQYSISGVYQVFTSNLLKTASRSLHASPIQAFMPDCVRVVSSLMREGEMR